MGFESSGSIDLLFLCFVESSLQAQVERPPRENPESDFEAYLASLANNETAEIAESSNGFKMALNEIERMGRTKGEDVWTMIDKYPKAVQPIARMVSALPTTQVSVERLFSHLKLVLRENRATMGADLADAILFLRTNRCIQ